MEASTDEYQCGAQTPSESRGASPQWQGFIDGLRSAKSDRIVEAVITAAEGLGTRIAAMFRDVGLTGDEVVDELLGYRTAVFER